MIDTSAPLTTLMPRDAEVQAIAEALAAPFRVGDIKFKPQIVKANRALAMAYVDARLIQDRLDEVLGMENWQDTYEILADGSVLCRLKLRLGGRWISKTDVGSPSEQPDAGDRMKAAFSDALKRAAVKFGIGRYLYRLPAQWVDYDPLKKQIAQLPQLSTSAVPRDRELRVNSPGRKLTDSPPQDPIKKPVSETVPSTPAPPTAESPSAALPANGRELHRRLQDYDLKLASADRSPRGALVAHVTQAGIKAGYTANMAEWSGAAIRFAVEAVKQFEQSLKASEHKNTVDTAA